MRAGTSTGTTDAKDGKLDCDNAVRRPVDQVDQHFKTGHQHQSATKSIRMQRTPQSHFV